MQGTHYIQAVADDLYTKDPNSRKAAEMSDFCTFYTGILKVSNRLGGFYALTKDEKTQLEEISRKETAIASNAKAILDFIEERPREYYLEGPLEVKMMQIEKEEEKITEEKELKFLIHPNPSSGSVTFTLQGGLQLSDRAYYEITDLTGRQIALIKINQATNQYVFNADASGVYLIVLRDNSEILNTQRVIIKND